MALLHLVQVGSSCSEMKLAHKHMAKLLSGVFIVCSFALIVSGQAQKPCIARGDVVLATSKATVYIAYEGVGQFKILPGRLAAADPPGDQKSADEGKTIRGFRLRLHNNTHWAISFPTDSLYLGAKTTAFRLCDGRGAIGLRDGIEVNARYEVEVLAGRDGVRRPRVANRLDVSSTSWIPPGGSVLFVVSSDYLSAPLAIYVPFNYEWETDNGHVRGDEPQHRVYFYSWNLPENVR